MPQKKFRKKISYFDFQDGVLHAEKVSILELAKRTKTPFYVYSATALEDRYNTLTSSLKGLNHSLYYSVKSNSNVAVLRVLSLLGSGMDVVSGGEYLRARKAGVLGERIVFSGVGKTPEEMALALTQGIRQFNVESIPEIEQLDKVASKVGKVAPVSIRINPDVDAKTHQKIMTGKSENKFGIPISLAEEVYNKTLEFQNISIVGVDVHIGSQITNLKPFEIAFEKIAGLIIRLRSSGQNISRVDIGGGIGISYYKNQADPISPDAFSSMLKSIFGKMGLEIQIEPGRYISGNAGLLITSVIFLKEGADHNFLIIDAGMNDLIRPALYEANHELIPLLSGSDKGPKMKVDVVGPICESSDVFVKKAILPKLSPGDLIAIYSAGAYGAVMSSEYNTRPLIPELMVKGNISSIIRARPTLQEVIDKDQIPYWLR